MGLLGLYFDGSSFLGCKQSLTPIKTVSMLPKNVRIKTKSFLIVYQMICLKMRKIMEHWISRLATTVLVLEAL